MKSNYWRSMNYVSQLPQKPIIIVNGGKTVIIQKKKSTKYQKFLCINRETGNKTCAIIFPEGHVYIGDDVWRMSNKADFCEYDYYYYRNKQEALKKYEFISGKTPFGVCWERR